MYNNELFNFFKIISELYSTVRVSQSCTYVRSTKTKMYYITLPLHNSTLDYFDLIFCELGCYVEIEVEVEVEVEVERIYKTFCISD